MHRSDHRNDDALTSCGHVLFAHLHQELQLLQTPDALVILSSMNPLHSEKTTTIQTH